MNVIYKNPEALPWSGIYMPEEDNVLKKEVFLRSIIILLCLL